MQVCILCLALGLCHAASWREDAHAHVLACSPTNPTKPQKPCSAMSAEHSVGNIMNKAAQKAPAMVSVLFSV